MGKYNEGMTMALFLEFMIYNHEQSSYINWEIPVVVCMSNAGYYIGQMDDGVPYTRLSREYWPTREEAQAALDDFQFVARTNL